MSTELISPLSTSAIDLIVQPWWQAWAGLAWGFRRHSVVLWACAGTVQSDAAKNILGIDHPHPLDFLIFYRELCKDLVPEYDLARMIVDATPGEPRNERKHLTRFCAGKDVFQCGTGATRTIADLMNPTLRAAGITPLYEVDDGPDSRVNVFRQFFEGLRKNHTLRSDDPPRDKQSGPVIFISEDCPKLISTIPNLQADEPKNPEDVKIVGTMQDQVWAAAMNVMQAYPMIRSGEPYGIRRFNFIQRGEDPMHKAQLMREFELKNRHGRRIRSH